MTILDKWMGLEKREKKKNEKYFIPLYNSAVSMSYSLPGTNMIMWIVLRQRKRQKGERG